MRTATDLAALVAAGVVPNVAYLAIGLWIHRLLRLDARGAERLALAYVFGTGAASLAILVLRLLGVPVPLFALALVAASAAPLLREGRAVSATGAPRWVRAIDAATIGAVVLTFLAALGPETFWDGFEYHLPMVRAWSEGPIRVLPGMVDAEFRAGVDLLYLPAVSFGQPDAAAAVSACFAVALAALIRAEAGRRASLGAGALAAFFALVVRFALDNAPSTYVDLGVGAYGFLALLFADRWNRTGAVQALTVSALCIAFAANAKLHAAVLAPAVLAIVSLGGRPPPWRIVVRCAAWIAALVTPWFVKAAVTTGNPFFPFLGEWFGYGPSTAAPLALRRMRLATDYPGARDLAGLGRYFVSLSFGRAHHSGAMIGPLPLALVPLALHRLSRPTFVLGAAVALLLVLQFLYMPALRFGSPLLPFFAVAAAVGGARLARSGRLAAWTLGVALAVMTVHHVTALGTRYLPRVASLRSPATYERSIFPDQYALRDMVERAEPVVGISKGAVLWMPKPVYNLHWERNGELFLVPVGSHLTPPDEALALLKRRGVRSLVLEVRPPHPRDGAVGYPTVDRWIRSGAARLRGDIDPPRSRQGLWALVELR